MIKVILQQLSYYIKENWLVCIISLYALAMVIPPIPFSVPVYYAMLIMLFAYMITREGVKFNFLTIAFLCAAAFSIVVGNPPQVFKSWERLILLIIVIGAVFPLFESFQGDIVHAKMLKVTLWLFVMVGCISFGCYILGINYMMLGYYGEGSHLIAGAFGGITQHSMILGPLSAFGTIFLVSQLLYGRFEKPTYYIIGIAIILCSISTFVSASRGAVVCWILGIIVVFFMKYKDSIGKLFRKTLVIIIALTACYPLYSNFTAGVLSKQLANEERGGTFSSRDEKWTNRMNEFEKSPIFGIGFASIDLNTNEGAASSTRSKGVIEPGSTWLAVLSMTGIAGAIPMLSLVFGTLYGIYKLCKIDNTYYNVLLFALLLANVIHQFAEGYALAGGSYLCYFFWLLLGVTYAQVHSNGELLIIESEEPYVLE